jgi:two-component system response regulator AtoC
MSTMTNNSWAATFADLPPEEMVFGRSVQMQIARANMKKVALANVPLLIRGESGTGKETIAKVIHRWSQRRNGPFVKVSCPAIPEALLESELFGYEKGAFTGAYDAKLGLVERAHNGTLLLDEVAELSMSMQAKLLEVLQNGHFSRLGGGDSKVIDARIECTTNHSLEREIAAGSFRHDLFYRINVVVIDIPPLRNRREDIPSMVEYFRQQFNADYSCNAAPISNRTLKLLEEYSWPGNIRELENVMKRYVILESEDALAHELLGGDSHDLASQLDADDAEVSLKSLTRQAVRDLERKIILQVLHANNWNRKEAARVLKVSYRGLFYKIKSAGVPGKKMRQTVKQAEASRTIT